MRPLPALLLVCSLAPVALAQEVRPAPAPRLMGQQPALPVEVEGGPAALSDYRLEAEQFPIEFGAWERHRGFAQADVSFPSPLRERWAVVHGTYYRPAGLKPGVRVPAAVVVHHLGGSFDAEKYLAQHLAQHGVAAVFVSLPNYGKRREKGTREGFLHEQDPVGSFLGFRQAALDVIRASDFLRALPEVDPERVGAVGVSLGACVTALARGVDPRLGRTVLVLAGGDLPRVLEESSEVKGLLAKAPQLDPAALAETLTSVDPLTFATRVRAQDVLMINARRDEVIPVRCTQSLWEAYGRPPIRWLDCGHYGTVLHIFSVMNDCLDHLRGAPARP